MRNLTKASRHSALEAAPETIALRRVRPGVRPPVIGDASAALRAAEQKLAMLFRESPDVVLVVDAETGDILAASSMIRQRLGYEPAALIGQHYSMLFPPHLAVPPNALLDIVRSHGSIFEEQEFRRVDGSVCPMDLTATFAPWDGHEAVIAILRDLTERRRAQAALRDAFQRYHDIFEHAVEGIFQTSVDGRYLNANQALATMYGYDSPAELMTSLTDIARDLYVDPHRRQQFRQIMAEHGRVQGFESQIRRRDGNISWISENARAVRDSAGRVRYYEGTVVDISARKEAEAANARLIHELEAANQLKSEFVATISHELRTPLNIIVGYNAVLLDGGLGGLNAEQMDAVRRVDRHARQLAELIESTLDLQRIATGRLRIESERVRMADLLRELDGDTCELRPNPNVHFSWHVAADVPELRTDGAKLRVVLKNLIGNALKFTEQGEVSVDAHTALGGIEIAVRDTGIGIPLEMRETIFEPFRQLDASSTRPYDGVGLGLYVVRRLLDILGGHVTMESTVGGGSVFRVWMPVAMRTDTFPD